MIIDAGDGTYGIVEVDLDDPNHEEMQQYQHDDVEGSYGNVTAAALGYAFGEHGFKVHPDLQGRV
jgi:hypothetical protein